MCGSQVNLARGSNTWVGFQATKELPGDQGNPVHFWPPGAGGGLCVHVCVYARTLKEVDITPPKNCFCQNFGFCSECHGPDKKI